MDAPPELARFVPLPTISRLLLGIAVGLFVGLEREHRGKEAGLRTFGFAALLGCLGGLLGEPYALLSLGFLAVLIVFLNLQSLRADQGTELTTSAALLVTGIAGVLCGLGHTVTPVAVAVLTAALLAWKEPLAGFSLGLTESELRSAILLALLAFVVYPVLPETAVDPWGLVAPRAAWVTVIVVAAVGFVSYVLLKLYGLRGLELSGFLGGLVNSSATVADLAERIRSTGTELTDAAYRGMLLATAAMFARNTLLLGVLGGRKLAVAALPLAYMLASSLVLALLSRRETKPKADFRPALRSPFSLMTALKYGAIFLMLQVAGTLAQRSLGAAGVYAVSAAGGLVSSASAVASVAVLAAQGTITPAMASVGALIASITSAAVMLPLVARVSRQPALNMRLAIALLIGDSVGGSELGARGRNGSPIPWSAGVRERAEHVRLRRTAALRAAAGTVSGGYWALRCARRPGHEDHRWPIAHRPRAPSPVPRATTR